jgi:hypothetical protein
MRRAARSMRCRPTTISTATYDRRSDEVSLQEVKRIGI